MRWVLIFLFSLYSFSLYASPTTEFLIVPSCLLENDFKYDELAKSENLHFIKTDEMDLLASLNVKDHSTCRGFLNVTMAWHNYARHHQSNSMNFLKKYLPKSTPSDFTHTYKVQYQSQVQALIEKINIAMLTDTIKTLTKFPDRYVDSDNGVQAADWIRGQLDALIKTSGRNDVQITVFPTINKGKQPSIMMKIGKNLKTPAVILGTHMDTLERLYEYRPGADDNASGVATLLQTAEILLNSQYKFKKPIYLIWYAGSEKGKLGAQSVVANFKRNNIAIDSVLQLDMTGYVSGNGPSIGLMDDFTDTELTAFIADLTSAYVQLPAGSVRCGFACSDHIAWYENGNRVAYPFETMEDESNPYIHTRDDKQSKISVDHVADFVKLSLGFAVELAGLGEG